MEESERSKAASVAPDRHSKAELISRGTQSPEEYLAARLSHIELHPGDSDNDEEYGDDADSEADVSFSGDESDSSSDSDASDLSMMRRVGFHIATSHWEPYDADEYEESFNRTQFNSDDEEATIETIQPIVTSATERIDEQKAMQISSLLRSRLRIINSRNNSPMHEYLTPEPLNKEQERLKRKTKRAHQLFEKGPLKTRVECSICLTPLKQLHARMCCSFDACNRCMKSYVEEKVRSGCVHIECPNDKCTKLIHRDEIMARLGSRELREKFQQFLVDANHEVNRKTCPRCSHVKTFDLALFKSSKTRPRRVTCDKCELEWCFVCHAPWHEALKCAKFQKGDVFLKKWAKEECKGQKNAQRCPKCKVYIQRSKGCDHMTCSQCKTEFCYKCGEKFRKFIFIGMLFWH